MEEHWTSLREALSLAAKETIGYKHKRNQDWFDESDESIIAPLIKAKILTRLAFENHPTPVNKDRHRRALADCQRGIREAQNTWWWRKAEEIQNYAEQREMMCFYNAIKEIYGPTRSSVGGLKNGEGTTTITDTEGILLRWKSHFENLLNDHPNIPDDFLRGTPQHPIQQWMVRPPSKIEFENALKRMRPGKAPGPDNIPLEFFTMCGTEIQNHLLLLILKIWESGTVPQDFKDVIIVTIFKKGDREDCNNYRGISLLSIAGKILARILLDRLLVRAEQILPESQSGFRPSRGTIDMIFCARQLQEKSREHQQPLRFIFWDLKKAFDKVPRTALWAVLARYGCPPHYVSLVRALHDGMFGRVQHQGSLSDPFAINEGLRQGDPLASVAFSMYVAALMNEVPPEIQGIDLRYRMDGGLHNTKRFRTRNRTNNFSVRELQYADDSATPTHTAEDLQRAASAFNNAYERFGMQVNTEKTKTLFQHPPGEVMPNTDITLGERQLEEVTLGERQLEEVEQFSYLGSILTTSATCRTEAESRIRAAHAAFG